MVNKDGRKSLPPQKKKKKSRNSTNTEKKQNFCYYQEIQGIKKPQK